MKIEGRKVNKRIRREREWGKRPPRSVELAERFASQEGVIDVPLNELAEPTALAAAPDPDPATIVPVIWPPNPQ